jgi:hypothetical protein
VQHGQHPQIARVELVELLWWLERNRGPWFCERQQRPPARIEGK